MPQASSFDDDGIDASFEVDPTTSFEDDEAASDKLEEATDLYHSAKNHWEPIYDAARDDLEFLSDEPDAQWNAKDFSDRANTGRPTISVDYLTQFVHQVANNIRMNTPTINPLPVGSDASIETADIIKGIIKNIEYVSCADEAYDTAATSGVKCSIGFVLIDHDFTDDTTFDQQLLIKRVVNPFLIYMDPDTMESDGRDQEFGFVLERVKVKTFKIEYPDAEVSSFGDDSEQGKVYGDEDEITLAQFYQKQYEDTMITGVNGQGQTQTRKTQKCTIYRYKLSGAQILGTTTFPGDYIPIVPFYGEEAWRDGKRYLHSLIRKAKTPQQMFNLMKSVEYEILMKQPIAPVMVGAGAIENYKDDWLNPSKAMALRFDEWDDEGRQLSAPQRLNPPGVPTGMVQSAASSVDDMKASMGLYNNALGQQGQEVSGKAIDARKIQGDVATYHYGDNAVRSITQVGRILVCALPVVYDTARVVQMMDEENTPKPIGINGATVDGQDLSHMLANGKYDVRVITGASFATRRQESAQFYSDAIKQDPELMKVAGDLMFKNMDIAGSQEMAARMRKIMDPKLLQNDDSKGTPQEQALQSQLDQSQQVIQKSMQEIQQLQQQLQDKNAPVMAKVQNDAAKLAQAKEEHQTESLLKVGELSIKSRANDITEQNNAMNFALKEQDQKISQILAVVQQITNALPAQTLTAQAGNTAANNGAVNNVGATNV